MNKSARVMFIKKNLDFIVVDTPGQIEIFTWSASGTIITEAIASRFETFLFYILDTSRSNNNPQVFVSNILQAISVPVKIAESLARIMYEKALKGTPRMKSLRSFCS